MSEANRTRTTYYYERWRAVAAGTLETAGSTFLLLIAVRWFETGAFNKALVAGGGSLGLLLSPVVVTQVAAAGWPAAQAAARILLVGAVSFLLPALVPALPMFILGSVAGMASSAAVIPLLTQIYQENYPEQERGRRFSRTVMIRIACAAGFGKLAGDVLTGHIDYFRWLLLVFASALGFAAFCLAHCPSRPLSVDGGAHPFRALRFVREDALFRRTLICWMLMGFANLMMLPLRVEYLASPKYHLALKADLIALLTTVVPNLARLVVNPLWGHLFDRMNFFALRVTLNVGFAIGILAFFVSDSFTGLILGAVVYGISNAGGDVAWSLWVTKFAPPERVADYMSVHTFFTGVRGVLAPVVGFYCAAHFSLGLLAGLSSLLIFAATALLIPEIKFGKAARASSALVEEVSD